jgi:hypothetical protein
MRDVHDPHDAPISPRCVAMKCLAKQRNNAWDAREDIWRRCEARRLDNGSAYRQIVRSVRRRPVLSRARSVWVVADSPESKDDLNLQWHTGISEKSRRWRTVAEESQVDVQLPQIRVQR